ncbi:amidase [Stygiolobus caldivivus]|uniref:Amidase n=1 Tax=Stygiolobus caldivivus TaxID=2824673 RepID=A0A8D5U717_9CREN|nr:amidase [Stygiolobus caldivivus]BCU70504.1 amidase [Stygiolobus caldivivus]
MSLESLNSKYNIFITIKRVKERERGKLSGLKFAIKDIIDVKGLPTTAGSRFLHYIPETNAYIVQKILNEGGEIIGKTNTHEFAMGATNTSSLIGPAKNPIDPERISGGSSGGSAVAVALGLADIGVGTDTGGSIRIPASLCGVIGFKPTTGLISTEGVIPFSWTFDTVGFLTKDIKLLSKILDSVLDNKIPLVYQAKRKPKIGLFLFGDDIASKTLLKFVNKLSNYYDIVEIDNRIIRKYASFVRKTIALSEAYSYHKRWFEIQKQNYSEDVKKLLEIGKSILGYEYVESLRIRNVIIREYIKIFSKVDVLISPTTKAPAPKIADVVGKELEYRDILISNTEIFNVVGAPSISIPVEKVDNLPIGLMISGLPYEDGVVLDIAERILGIVGFISNQSN